MIVLVTTRGHRALRSLPRGTFGVPTPKVRLTHYERLIRVPFLARATYIFGDLERLANWELRVAAQLYRAMVDAGLRCLNDPARVMTRLELLNELHLAGINPFTAYRADEQPRPARFPVFIRSESDHKQASSKLLHSQPELDRELAELRRSGIPARGLLVTEFAAEPHSANLWAKWGTWRIGDRTVVEHMAVDNTWLVKFGDKSKMTDALVEEERRAVESNRFGAEVGPAFDIAGIEFGRADHALFAGRSIIFEINTNPHLGTPARKPTSRRRADTSLIARRRIAEALERIDTPEGGFVRIASVPYWQILWWRPGLVGPRP